MKNKKYCDGVKRRDFIRVGAITGTGITLSSFLRQTEAAQKTGKATSAIFVNLTGGPTHMDTFDLKPDSDKDVRGEFNPIDTNVSGEKQTN